jgi:protein-S-isoprenylcysteine O-methyltransferase Ste14
MAKWPAIARRIRVPLGFAFAALFLWQAKPTLFSIVFGGAVVVPGLLLRALASGHVQKNRELATSGPYAYTRNPLYLGSIVIATGFAVAGRNWWIAAVLAVLFAVIYIPVIRSEEDFLQQLFPDYADYKSRVPRLFPRLSPAARDEGAFSWELYRQHREYNAVLGSLGVLAALGAKLLWMRNF